MSFSDHFSSQADTYSRFRPHYPRELFQFLAGLTPRHELAWDCATGNGQAARGLAEFYAQVKASDASAAQIEHSRADDNIEFLVSPSEQTPFADNSFDLITVAQALHWFDLDTFYKEVHRVIRPGGILAVWCYGLFSITADIDALLWQFYDGTVGAYWPPERYHVANGYAELEFPFTMLETPPLAISVSWNLEELAGYLGSWSAVRYYREQQQQDPVAPFIQQLESAWGEGVTRRSISWPVHLKVGVVKPAS